jgi:hypothetical protein
VTKILTEEQKVQRLARDTLRQLAPEPLTAETVLRRVWRLEGLAKNQEQRIRDLERALVARTSP